MAIFKCKMCGGTLEINPGESVATCEYCGSQQTLPKLDDDRKENLYDRANHFRRNNEFDKAAGIYEQILNEDNTDAEAYWSIVLCRYGIEYVEDPATHKRVPTVNRAQYTSIFDDDNYKSAIEHADTYQRTIYENEAKAINEIQKGILAISQKEEPFDVFICYKETDNSGRRTRDSVLANDLYHQLTQEGFKVFFSRITLEDKLGTAYEPYIFAALNSAKVMVVLGTKPEHFNAVWVKNEWSRYLSLVKQSGGKKVLIPAYRDMDPYDLPEEFSHLQAQDMSKLGFMQDLIRGIKKIAQKDELKAEPVVKQTVSVSGGNANVNSLLKRVSIFLEDGDWNSADEYCEKVLDIDPENADAYLGKLMAELEVHKREQLANCAKPFDDRNNYKKAFRFGDTKMKAELEGYNALIRERNENTRLSNIYTSAVNGMRSAKTEMAFNEAAEQFESIPGYKDADELAAQCRNRAKGYQYDYALKTMESAKSEADYMEAARLFGLVHGFKDSDKLAVDCREKAEFARKDAVYIAAKGLMNRDSVREVENAIVQFRSISGWKDADNQIGVCEQRIKDIKAKEEADRLEAERKAEELRIAKEKRKKKAKRIAVIITAIVAVSLAFVIVLTTVIIPNSKYDSAMELYNAQKYEDAYKAFNTLNYKDSADKAAECLFLKQKSGLTNVTVGSTIKFGHYEQDNNTSNGKEEIEWKVLAVEGNKALVISQYALDCQRYNSTYTDTTWEKCTLRTWLNETFYNEAFGADHQEMIISSTVSADKNPNYSTSPGNSTTDKVFLFSITEVNKYFNSDSARQCSATAYAKAQGVYTATSNGNCWWWLRSPGNNSIYAAYVYSDGSVFNYGNDVDYSHAAVRPALWINLGS